MSAILAAVIPTRNRGTLAQDAVRSLRDQDCDVDVFVSDNSDSPGPHDLRPDRELAVADHWDWALRKAMSVNRHMRVLVASGYYDFATPHYAADYSIDHLRLAPELRGNITTTYYEAGHMMYVHRHSLEKLARVLRAFVAS